MPLVAMPASLGSRAPRIEYHATFRDPVPSPLRPSTSPAYAGTVRTIHAVLNYPSEIAFDSVDGDIYVVDETPSSFAPEILRVTPSGATTVAAPLPDAQVFALTCSGKTNLVC